MPSGRRSRAQQLRRDVAELLLGVAPGSRMPTVRALAEHLDRSLGATQAALTEVERSGAFSATRRGRSGMVLEKRSVGELWSVAREEPMVIALPLPSTKTIHALATALKVACAESQLEAYLEFMRGSRHRLAALRSGRCHAAVMSALAAGGLSGPEEVTVLTLEPGSFVVEHRVFLRSDTPPRSLQRVGIDPDSYDFERLAELEFVAPIERVPGSYMQLAEWLRLGHIDALILDVEETFVSLGTHLESRPLAPATVRRLGGSNTAASIVTRAAETSVAAVLGACLADPVVRQVQLDVLAGRRTPSY